MSVITISRGTLSGGKMLAEFLGARLGYRCIDRDVIVERAAAHGASQEELRDALEKPPSLLDRFKHKRYMYLTLIQAALAEEVRTGQAIYHGLAGHLLLKDGGVNVLRVRIIAPLDFRLKMAQERLKLTCSEALAYIEKMDQHRKKWTQYLYGVDWGDPSLYDLVINLESITIPAACDFIAFIARQRCFEFTPECQAAMNDLALASRVRASLAINPPTSHLEVEVTARGGSVRIKGKLSRLQEIEDVQHVVRETPGVTDFNLDELVSRAEV